MIQTDTQPGGGSWTGSANGTLGVRKYLLQNWRADVVATTIDDGTPYEYVRYSPYGVPTSYPAGDANRNGETTTGDFTDMNTVLSGGSAAVVCHIDLNKDGLYPDTADTDFLNDESVLTAKKGGLNKVGTGSAGPSLRFAYAGYAWDPAIKAYHVRHRVYNADMGRWLTRDPAGYTDGLNLSQYVTDQPMLDTDPMGLIAPCLTCCGPAPCCSTCEDPNPDDRPGTGEYTHAQCCNALRADLDPKRRFMARTICCNGTKIVCIFRDMWPKPKPGETHYEPALAIWYPCMMKNEEYHQKDESMPCPARPGFSEPTNASDPNYPCRLHRAQLESAKWELECLRAKCGSDPEHCAACNKDARCEAILRNMIREVEDEIAAEEAELNKCSPPDPSRSGVIVAGG